MRFSLLKLEKRGRRWFITYSRRRGGYSNLASDVEITLWKRILYLERRVKSREVKP